MSISRDNNVAAAPGRVRNAKKNVVFGRLGALRVFLFLEDLFLLLLLQIKTKEETNVVLVLAINKKSRAMRCR